jgi:thiol-disulfide isomerase/thioredoxin
VSAARHSAGAAALRSLLVTLLLAGSAAAGFLVYRLAYPPATLHALAPAAAPSAPLNKAAPAPSAPEPEAAPARRIPETLPELRLPGLDGRPHALAEWRGHPLVVNFWASWCEPCRREIPLLKRVRREHAADGVEVVGIAIDFRDAAQKYARDSKMDYPVLVGEDGGYEAVAAFGMDPVLPFTVFADGQGSIVNVKIGELHPAETELVLARLKGLKEGRLTLEAARREIAEGTARLHAAASGAGTTH